MTSSERVIRPAALLPERAARQIMTWLESHDVSHGGCWSHDLSSAQRYSGPFDGVGGMRGSAKLLGSVHLTWDTYSATVFRVKVTEEGVAAGLTVESLCDELFAVAGLTLASCPRAALAPPIAADPFRARRGDGEAGRR